MMTQFKTQWVPGGMSLNHSGIWLVYVDKDGDDVLIKFLYRKDY